MNKVIGTLFGILAFVILLSNVQTTNASLWDLQIDVKLEKSPLSVGDVPVIIGKVTDHAGKPISDAEIKIRLGQNSILTATNSTGDFLGEFSDFDELPGSHIVNVYATIDDKIGLKSINFQVKGELSVFSQNQKILSTPEAIKYLHSTASDFENDPLGLKLYYHYQYIQTQFLEEQKEQLALIEEQQYIDAKRDLSIELTKQVMEAENPGAGIYSGYKYDRFVSNLDNSVKDIIIRQLNYTVDVFYQAQNAMNEVLANGGTMQEARKAYFEKASISRELMEALTLINQTNSNFENTTNANGDLMSQLSTNGTDNYVNGVEGEKALNLNGTIIDVVKSGSIIYLNVNGTIIKLYINGTEVIQITNSSK